jgi:hypothetical protein
LQREEKMTKCLLAFVLCIVSVSPCFSQDIVKVVSPVEVTTEVSVPKELNGLQWNRWTSKNFVVCAINDAQAQYLHKHLELVKGWAFSRWGIPDMDFSTECKIIGVDDPVLFKKLEDAPNLLLRSQTASNAALRRV